MRFTIGVLVLLLCLASCIFNVIGNACPKSESAWARACRYSFGSLGSITCLASCILAIIAVFRSV